MIYRRATIEDFLQIAHLDRIGWGQNRNSNFIPDGEHLWRFFVEYSSVFVAVQNNRIIGVANLFKSNQDSFLLHKIIVHNDFRDSSVGQGLLKKIIDECDDYGFTCVTTVDPDNQKMLHLCQKFGFSDTKFIEGYYRPEEDRYLLTRPIQA